MRWNTTVTLRTPQMMRDPKTGNQIPRDPLVVSGVLAFVAQASVATLRQSLEISGAQQTSTAVGTLVLPAGTTITSASTATDDVSGQVWRVVGEPAIRHGVAPGTSFIAAQIRAVSDLQEP
jgi:hypothetical protein